MAVAVKVVVLMVGPVAADLAVVVAEGAEVFVVVVVVTETG